MIYATTESGTVTAKKRQVEELIGGRECQRLVLRRRRLRHHVTSHAGDDEARPFEGDPRTNSSKTEADP
jgi:hypothetical protein